ncbi:zinc finger SWIM domain-containing protein 8 homolog [Cydia splendana]|uniref:zinc finger SWIM domain-containing protein 8 homolog n=1 Tax=Cydia splendana TaxID=1100963 RepID=UPI00300C095C
MELVPINRFKVAGASNSNGKGGRQAAPVDVGSPLLDWEEGDHFSFEDSERFEGDSLCSWSSEPESLCNNWRGWRRPNLQNSFGNRSAKKSVQEKTVSSLSELAAKCVACHIPFELVEHVYPPVPEQLQLQIAFWSFPDSEDDIRLYSCLANGSADEFQRGEHLFRDRAVKDVLQIGFHLSATVSFNMPRAQFNVAVTFDRQRISSCNCTCSSTAHWCSHIVAVCLYRIHLPTQVCLRAPVSESLQRLRRDQLQKFAQYLISELPRQVLPTAQRILDELLSAQPNQINTTCGAPDPTAGASAYEYTSWFLDEKTLHNNINKILVKFCVPAPIVFSDVNYLSTSAPPAAAEWSSLLRPLRGREPEGMWNLLSIVREMFKRSDRNAIPLLEIITEEVMACEQIIVWWYSTKAALVAWGGGGKHGGSGNSAAQHACSSLCDEVVVLWRLAALNPGLAPHERDTLHEQFTQWHMKVLDKVAKNRNNHMGSSSSHTRHTRTHSHPPYINGISENEVFPGFQPAMEACYLEWDDYQIPGVTYTKDLNPLYHSPFTIFRHADKQADVHQVNSSKAVLNNEMSLSYRLTNPDPHRTLVHRTRINVDLAIPGPSGQQPCGSGEGSSEQPGPSDGNHSSVSSEGFCENEEEILVASGVDTDSQESSSPAVSSDDAARRVSNDDSVSDDDCNLYFYDTAAARRAVAGEGTSGTAVQCSAGATPGWECGWEVSFARAEGLQAHGHARDACALGARLARELLARPPALGSSTGGTNNHDMRKARRRHMPSPRLCAASHRLSCLASATLAKCAFLCTVLAEFSEHHELAFRVGLFALEMARPPASTKALEVKLNNQETELVALLKKLPTGPEQLALAREKAEQLRDGTLRNRGPALLPIALASFLFDVLVLSATDKENKHPARQPSDEALGFEAAVAALGLKANVSEAEHPLLCEGTRRQRGELALTLLAFYKDDSVKLARIMNKLLDRDIHQLTKGPMVSVYYTNNPRLAAYRDQHPHQHPHPHPHPAAAQPQPPPQQVQCQLVAEMERLVVSEGGASPPAHPPPHQQPPHQTLARPKDSRYKGKRVYPSVPNQPSEASAHFMFELAKSVLFKAGGSSSTSLFTQTSCAREHHGPHRGLHMAAFQLGLYALGLHNCVSANWLSRTYSSHVSWITGQAMDIGAPAILFLIDAWEGHLTPPEAAGIADKASSGRDVHTVRAAAELALSVLPHAHALNYNEIQRAVLQCKEQSDAMLERACLTVEAAAKGGGVYPEVLYTVARYWHELYLRQANEDTEPLLEEPQYRAVPPVHVPVPYPLPYPFTYHPYPPIYQLQYGGAPPPHAVSGQYALPPYFVRGLVPHAPLAPLPTQMPAQLPAHAPHASHQPHQQHAQLPQHAQIPQHPPPLPVNVNLPAHAPHTSHQPHQQHAQLPQHAQIPQHPPPLPVNVNLPAHAPHTSHQPHQQHAQLPQHAQIPQHPPPLPVNVNLPAHAPHTSHQPHQQHAQLPQHAQIPQHPPPLPVNVNLPAHAPHTSHQPHQQHAQLPQHAQIPQHPPPLPVNVNLPAHAPHTSHQPHQQHAQLPQHAQIPQHPPPLPVNVNHGAPIPPPLPSIPGVAGVAGVGPVAGHGGVGVAAPLPAPVAPPLPQAQLRRLLAAYRVGMLALETQARRVHDDRPQNKFGRNPPYGEHVKWLLRISKRLGAQYLHQFCVCAVNSVVSPFVLYELCVESAHWLARGGPHHLLMQHLRGTLAPLVQKCQQMYIQCIHQKLYHLTPVEYEEFVSIVLSARTAFQLTPEGNTQFKEWLASLRRSKSCKKDLWTQLNAALQTNGK